MNQVWSHEHLNGEILILTYYIETFSGTYGTETEMNYSKEQLVCTSQILLGIWWERIVLQKLQVQAIFHDIQIYTLLLGVPWYFTQLAMKRKSEKTSEQAKQGA